MYRDSTKIMQTKLMSIPRIQLQLIRWCFPTHVVRRKMMTSKPTENAYQNRTNLLQSRKCVVIGLWFSNSVQHVQLSNIRFT